MENNIKTEQTRLDELDPILHQLGLNHEKLTFLHNGRNMRITDVSGDVIREVVS